jgi:4-hydroxysphinganine ceramide fatty acyl 2-hydroxylase
MDDPQEHQHSKSAYQVLFEYQIGLLGVEEAIVNKNFIMTDSFAPEATQTDSDFKRNQFLNLDQPLLIQVWNSNFSKSFYLQQVHQPRHLDHSARLFSQPWLEVFTLTPWWVVPLIWFPITCALFYRSLTQQPDANLITALGKTMIAFISGNIIWTILEYTLHRFLFHVDDMLPDTPFFLMLHFLLHGIHHYLPVSHHSSFIIHHSSFQDAILFSFQSMNNLLISSFSLSIHHHQSSSNLNDTINLE